MKINSLVILSLLTSLFFSCKQNETMKHSSFKLTRDYSDFVRKMNNGDTLNIDINLSMCIWDESDHLQITKSNNLVYFQLIKRHVMNDSMHFNKVAYKFDKNTPNLDNIISNFNINFQDSHHSPFIIITNPKEKDTIILRTTSLNNRNVHIEKYHEMILYLYPEKMKEYQKRYLQKPPKPTE